MSCWRWEKINISFTCMNLNLKIEKTFLAFSKHLLKCILNMFILIIEIISNYKLDILKFILWLLFIYVTRKMQGSIIVYFTMPKANNQTQKS